MTTPFKHAALVGKYQARGITEMLQSVARLLRERGLSVSLDAETAERIGWQDTPVLPLTEVGSACDVAIVLGGDGTMLGVARQLAPAGIPLVGINQGRLGFITDIRAADWADVLGPMMAGQYEDERRRMIEGAVWRGGEQVFEGLALNDVVVARSATSGMIELEVASGEAPIAHIRADGVIAATPTGSTAYALSAGGPILHPAIAGWVLVPLASHSLTNRPIVLPDTEPLRVRIAQGEAVSAHFDMHGTTDLAQGDEVRLWRSRHEVRFLHPRGWSYYATLRRKLHWYGGGDGD